LVRVAARVFSAWELLSRRNKKPLQTKTARSGIPNPTPTSGAMLSDSAQALVEFTTIENAIATPKPGRFMRNRRRNKKQGIVKRFFTAQV
jgi:hypothetical protein